MLTHTAQKQYTVLAALSPAVEFSSSNTKADDRHQCGIFSSVALVISMVETKWEALCLPVPLSGLLTRLVSTALLAEGIGILPTQRR